MKDPNDKRTIDGFAALTLEDPALELDGQPAASLQDIKQLIDYLEPKLKKKSNAGRKPKGERALTAAEKQKAYRERKRAQAAQKQEPTSLIIDTTTRFTDALRMR